jgi:sigma-B regulation protein RsbU (phosphoserine phosphatase)
MLLRTPESIEELPPTGPILGPLPGQWETRDVTVPPSAFLAVYTDGLIEARNAENAQFGIEGLIDAIRTAKDGGLDAVADHSLTAMRQFSGRRAVDDVTLVLLGRR